MPGILVTFASDQHTRVPRLPEGNQLKQLYTGLFQGFLKHAGLDAPGFARRIHLIPSIFFVLVHDVAMSLIPVLVRDLGAVGLTNHAYFERITMPRRYVPSAEGFPSLSFVGGLVHIPPWRSLTA